MKNAVQRFLIVILFCSAIVGGCYGLHRLFIFVGVYFHDHKHHSFGIDEYNPGFESLMALEGFMRIVPSVLGAAIVIVIIGLIAKFIIYGPSEFE